MRDLWVRLGVQLHITEQEEKEILGSDNPDAAFQKVMNAGRFDREGDTYIPAEVVENYNHRYGTDYDPVDIDLDSTSNESYTVTEWCPYCESEIEMRWDVKQDGYKAFCPVCGKRLMLCDACMHKDGDCINCCDYNGDTDQCKYNTRFNAVEIAKAKERLGTDSIEETIAAIKAFDKGIGDIDDVVDSYENAPDI